jgi:hypothetical protein
MLTVCSQGEGPAGTNAAIGPGSGNKIGVAALTCELAATAGFVTVVRGMALATLTDGVLRLVRWMIFDGVETDAALAGMTGVVITVELATGKTDV